MIADMIDNKKLNSVATELFIRGRKLNFSIVFIFYCFYYHILKYQKKLDLILLNFLL